MKKSMVIQLKKFGTILVSRPSGKEAWLAFQPVLGEIPADEEMVIDFNKVAVLTPSWADEFLTPLFNRFNGKVKLLNVENPSVKASLAILGR